MINSGSSFDRRREPTWDDRSEWSEDPERKASEERQRAISKHGREKQRIEERMRMKGEDAEVGFCYDANYS